MRPTLRTLPTLGRSWALPSLSLAAVLAATVWQLRQQGRVWWCTSGDLFPWTGDAWSRHTSQHLFDPYTFTHVLHGFILCGLLSWMLPRVAAQWRFCLAVALEALWELFENTNYVINRYRETTAALGYEGDSVLNSLGDILACAAGIALATKLGWRRSVVVFVATEVVLLVWVRDSLILNIILLIYPVKALKVWQMGH